MTASEKLSIGNDLNRQITDINGIKALQPSFVAVQLTSNFPRVNGDLMALAQPIVEQANASFNAALDTQLQSLESQLDAWANPAPDETEH